MSSTSRTLNPQTTDEPKRLDQHPVAVLFSEAGAEIGSNDTKVFLKFLKELKELGVKVDFEGVMYGLPWCG